MSVQGTIQQSISISAGGAGINGYTQSVGNSAPLISVVFPANSNNTQFNGIVFNNATLQQIFLWSDKGMTIRFQNAAAPVATIVLQPGSPFPWTAGDGYFPNPFNAPVNTVFITTTQASQLKGYLITP
jgi:hypothetical protein